MITFFTDTDIKLTTSILLFAYQEDRAPIKDTHYLLKRLLELVPTKVIEKDNGLLMLYFLEALLSKDVARFERMCFKMQGVAKEETIKLIRAMKEDCIDYRDVVRQINEHIVMGLDLEGEDSLEKALHAQSLLEKIALTANNEGAEIRYFGIE